jgi:uncharacterized membrane protein YhfC
MIANNAIAGLAVSALIAIGAPLAIYFALRRRMMLSWRTIGIGALTFFVAALVLEQIVHYFVLVHPSPLSAFVKATKPVFVLYAVLMAGIFEETGRYIAMRRFVRPTGNPGTAVSYGLGHGGLESVLIAGLPLAAMVAVTLLLNAGVLQDHMSPALAKIHAQLVHLDFFTALIGGGERLIAIGLQIGLSILVWRAVEMRRIGFLFLAIALHALADTGAAMVQIGLVHAIWIAELGAFAVLVLIVALLRFLPKTG